MVSSFTKVRVGYGATHHSKKAVVSRMNKRADCSTNGFYTSPTAGQTVESGKEITVSWNTQCLNPAPQFIDVFLYAPSQNSSLIQAFNSAQYKEGSMKTTLNPTWWGSSANASLYFTIVEHGTPSFLTSIPAGPIFTATYDSSDPKAVPKSSDTSGSDSHSIIQDVKNAIKNMSGGAIAAAVIIPLLAIAVGIFFYLRYARKKRTEKTKRWSQAVDKRMSTISTDWRSMSGASASAAIRNSMAARSSTFGRPSSTFSAVGSGQAGVGARFGGLQTTEEDVPQMAQMRQARASTFGTGDRISRVSFAADPRLSVHDAVPPVPSPTNVRGFQTRSFHQGQTSFDDERDDEIARELQMSPTQTQGPRPLVDSEIAVRASGDDDEFRKEVLQMPAMTLMRTGHRSSNSGGLGELVIPPSILRNSTAGAPLTPALPSPTLKPTSPMPPSSPMGLMPPTNALSPDDMLRAYAAGRAPPPTSPLGSGATTIASAANGTGMRVLYAPSPTPSLSPDNNPFRKSVASRSMYTESMYSGVAEEDEAHGSSYGTAK